MSHCLVPASYVLLLRGGPGHEQVLLHLRQNTGYRDGHWALLAGHVELGESPHDAAVREAYEEAGVQVRPEILEPLTTMHRSVLDGGPIEQRVDFFFAARDYSGEPTIREPHLNARLSWFDLRDLPTPCVPHEHVVLAAVAAGAPLPAIMTGDETGPSART